MRLNYLPRSIPAHFYESRRFRRLDIAPVKDNASTALFQTICSSYFRIYGGSLSELGLKNRRVTGRSDNKPHNPHSSTASRRPMNDCSRIGGKPSLIQAAPVRGSVSSALDKSRLR